MTTILSKKVDRTDKKQEKGSFCQKGRGTVWLCGLFLPQQQFKRLQSKERQTKACDSQSKAPITNP